jgi:glucose-6-phosphate 1-dehydrogenase
VLDLPGPIDTYEPGTWGPESAALIVGGDEGWHDPKPASATPC